MAAPGGPPFFDVVFAQRASREYADTPVDDATIELILRAGTHAPSAENKQPWEFVVVRDPDVQRVIHDLTEAAWVTAGRAFSETRIPPELLKEVDYAIERTHGDSRWKGADGLADTDRSHRKDRLRGGVAHHGAVDDALDELAPDAGVDRSDKA